MAENNPAPLTTGNTASAFASAEPSPATQKLNRPRVFFPNLDGLRFVCFFMVFLFHINKSVTETYLANNQPVPGFFKIFGLLFQNGNLGVNFFFVLSGFLITFLLIKEKNIQVKYMWETFTCAAYCASGHCFISVYLLVLYCFRP